MSNHLNKIKRIIITIIWVMKGKVSRIRLLPQIIHQGLLLTQWLINQRIRRDFPFHLSAVGAIKEINMVLIWRSKITAELKLGLWLISSQKTTFWIQSSFSSIFHQTESKPKLKSLNKKRTQQLSKWVVLTQTWVKETDSVAEQEALLLPPQRMFQKHLTKEKLILNPSQDQTTSSFKPFETINSLNLTALL